MKIAVFAPREYGGTGLYRQYLPHEKLAEWGHKILFTDSLDVTAYEGFDIFMASKSWFVHANDLVRQLKKKGMITIIDFDDYWVLPPSHLLYHDYRKNNTVKLLTDGLKLYDYVTCTTPLLQSEISKLNPNVEIFENAIDPKNPQFRVSEEKTPGVDFGWIGGHCHEADLSILGSTPRRLHGDFTISLFGYESESGVYDRFANILSGNKYLVPDKFFLYGKAPARKYTQFYNQIDVALAPLVSDHFNSMKSELKMVEAGFMRRAIVVSNCYPYKYIINGKNCLVAEHKQHWAKRMQRLIDNPSQVDDLAGELYESVRVKYDMEVVTRRREQWYETLRPL